MEKYTHSNGLMDSFPGIYCCQNFL